MGRAYLVQDANEPQSADSTKEQIVYWQKSISGKNWSEKLDRDEYFDAVACRVKARELSLKYLNKQITLCGKCIEVCPYTRKYLAVVGE